MFKEKEAGTWVIREATKWINNPLTLATNRPGCLLDEQFWCCVDLECVLAFSAQHHLPKWENLEKELFWHPLHTHTPSCLPTSLSPRGVHRLKGHTLCLTALVWKPGCDCRLCLAKARALSFPFHFSSSSATVQGRRSPWEYSEDRITSKYTFCERNPTEIASCFAPHSLKKTPLKLQHVDGTLSDTDRARLI